MNARSELPSGLPRSVAEGEDLARFLTQKNHFSREKHLVKPAAFIPTADGETSVFRHGSEPRDALWQIGRDQIEARGRQLIGAGIVRARHATDAGLGVDPDEPPPRHAVVRGWPDRGGDAAERRAQQLERAKLVAQHAELLLVLGADDP